MQSKFVRHVRDLILMIGLIRQHLQRVVLGIIEIDGWPCISSFFEAALEDFHDAMCVRMAAVRQYGPGYEIDVQRVVGP
jgi:hypothetical protein